MKWNEEREREKKKVMGKIVTLKELKISPFSVSLIIFGEVFGMDERQRGRPKPRFWLRRRDAGTLEVWRMYHCIVYRYIVGTCSWKTVKKKEKELK